MSVQIKNIRDLKRQPVQGFPVPMSKQMSQPEKPRKVRRHKVRFPKPDRKEK